MESRSHRVTTIIMLSVIPLWSLCFVLLSMIPSSIGGDVKLTPVIKTLDGPIVGKVQSQGGTDLNFFLGVPYAKPPVGDLRFQLPQPMDKYTDVYEATELGPRCMQPRLLLSYIRQEMSEDCLYLNIITPGDSLGKGPKYPVMISILHESHLTGSGNDEIYLKAELVKRRNIILVTLNSRLNFFGYAKTEAEDGLAGNMALWDENFAIRYVKNNIEAFGGDPNLITIRGQGSGGTNVRAHTFSPYARGLFKNTIVEDRGYIILGERKLDRVEASTDIVLDRVGCLKAKDRLKCLQDVSAEDIISALPKRYVAFAPIIDSNYHTITSTNAEQVEVSNDVNTLFGFAADYGSIDLATVVPEIYAKAELTYDDALDALSIFVESNQVKKIAEIFIGDPNKPISIRKIQDGLVRFFNEIVPCDLYYAANLIAEADNLKKGVYTYEYNHVAQSNEYKLCDIDRELGVCVRNQQSPIFGQPYSSYWFHNPADRKMADIMMDIYSSFMRTGKPQLPNGKDWPNWNDPKSKDPVIATVVLDPKNGGYVDTYSPKFCLDNLDLVNSSLINKFHPFDRYELETQAKVDKKSSYTDFLYNAIQSIYYIDY
ncbi:para-nitrobenzyl esterase-like [Brevipalpus obovatus]|uniref:para-nitrobenzyl esterase-like n=1 Tax=Brevipalpus obovatus TaxID=246614 RepID=UPI003D9F9748